MTLREDFEKGFRLRMEERLGLLENLIRNLDSPDLDLDAIGAQEPGQRQRTNRQIPPEGIPGKDDFRDSR